MPCASRDVTAAGGGGGGSSNAWRGAAFASSVRSAPQCLQRVVSPRVAAPQKAQNQSSPALASANAAASVTPSRSDFPLVASTPPKSNSDSLPVSSRGLLHWGQRLCRARIDFVSHEVQFHVPSMMRVLRAMRAS
ncbi:hypothetical protein MYXA107069_27395 [Myxococcus xanthus]|nr:hypothetical protein MyxoNM_31370 [Myxococcus xanthus]SDX90328.1 hypothetical protein SAMN05444383_114199 [Myxococcus xanthus]